MSKLPTSFTSLYRLFLRASSASVLHNSAARKQLRSIFRPTFDAAAQVVRDLQSSRLSRSERISHERFLDVFQKRMDGTLGLLLNAAQYRGVPHRLIYNMNQLRKAHFLWVRGKYYTARKWNPKVVVINPGVQRPRDIERRENDQIHERCWDAFGEVMRMAEGRHALSLGRLYLKPWILERR